MLLKEVLRMKSKFRKIAWIVIASVMLMPGVSYVKADTLPKVSYMTHVQKIGWQDWKSNGELSGTTGQSKRLESIKIELPDLEDLSDEDISNSGITYRTHIEKIGWQDWKSNGELSGTTGQAKRLEAIQIKLTGDIANKYDIYYTVHAQHFGWLGWAKNGEVAGTSGYAYRLEAIKIKLVKKGEAAPGSTSYPYKSNTSLLNCSIADKNIINYRASLPSDFGSDDNNYYVVKVGKNNSISQVIKAYEKSSNISGSFDTEGNTDYYKSGYAVAIKKENGYELISKVTSFKACIENADSQYSIECDVKLTGKGTGYHAKILACTSQAAVSFGLQYDKCAVAPYTNKTAFLVENVKSNNKGGQQYVRTGYGATNRTYHIMLTVQKSGQADFFVNGTRVGRVSNPNLANKQLYLRVEGSGRKNGDSVNAVFTNIKVKTNGKYDALKSFGTHIFDTNSNIHSNTNEFASKKKITINGSVKGLSSSQDWDNAYNKVSGITQFVG